MKRIIISALTAAALLLAVAPAHGMGRMGGTTGRGASVVVAAQQTFLISNHQAVIVPRPFLFPQQGVFISTGVAAPSGFVAFRTFPQGLNRFGCCFGPVAGGGVFLGDAEADSYYAYPYPVSAAPAYQPAPADEAPPVAPPVFCYVGGCYHLHGNGGNVPYQRVWVPAVPGAPPGPPPAAPRI